jgi:hypothetical protein
MRACTQRQTHKPNLVPQKILGVVVVAMSILLVYFASQGVTVEDRDCSAILFTVPIGLYLIFSKHNILT